MSRAFEATIMNWRSADQVTFSTSKLPGVSAVTAPPFEEIEYKCAQPSFSEANTIRSPAAHCNWLSPIGKRENESISPGPDFQISFPMPLATSTTRIDHGRSRSLSADRVSVTLNNRM